MRLKLLTSKNAGTLCILLLATISCGCSLAVKPIYNDVEKAKADRMVSEFHKLYNESRFDEVYNLLDESVRPAVDREQFISTLKQVFEKLGKARSATVSEANVFPKSPIEVRAIYNVNFEKGPGQEWFICNIRGEEARLVEYRAGEGFDQPKSK
jgi:hypothetical protein